MIFQEWPLFYPQIVVVHEISSTYTDVPQPPPVQFTPQAFLRPFYLGDVAVIHEIDPTYQDNGDLGERGVLPMWRSRPTYGDLALADQVDVVNTDGGETAEPLFPMWAVLFFLGDSTFFTEAPEPGEPGFIAADHQFLPISLIPYFLGSLDVVHEIDPTYQDNGDLGERGILPMWRLTAPYGDSSLFIEQPEAGEPGFEQMPGLLPMWALWAPYGESSLFTEQPEPGEPGWEAGLADVPIAFRRAFPDDDLFDLHVAEGVVDVPGEDQIGSVLWMWREKLLLSDSMMDNGQVAAPPAAAGTSFLRVARGLTADTFFPEGKMILIGGRRRTAG